MCMCGYCTSNAGFPSANPPLNEACKVTNPSDLELYSSPNGSISLDVRTDDDTVWSRTFGWAMRSFVDERAYQISYSTVTRHCIKI
jgi:hypothetical protein